MKKIKLLVLLLCLLFPLKGFAKDIGLELTSIQFKEKTGTALELEEATIDNNTINLYVKFLEEGDSITYKLNVKNTVSESYRLGLTSNDDYLLYEISNEEINPNETTTILITVTYNTTPAEGTITQNQKLTINIKDKDNNIIQLTNPKTNPNTIIMIITLLVITAVVIIGIKARNKKKIIPLILTLFLIPTIVYATITQELSLNINYKLNSLTGLRYREKLVYLFEEDEEYENYEEAQYEALDNQFYQEKTKIEQACSDEVLDDRERPNTIFDATSDLSANLYYMFDKEDNLGIISSVTIDVDLEDPQVIVGECYKTDFDRTHFIYNGNPLANNEPISYWLEEVICPRFRELIESQDAECIDKLILDSQEGEN